MDTSRSATLLVFGLACGCIGDIGDPHPGAAGGVVDVHAKTAVVGSGARRLTRTEYDDTLRDLLQDTTSSGFAKLPEDVNDPFDNDYETQLVSPALIDAAETLANEAALRALADAAIRDSIVPCTPTGPDDATCLSKFIRTFGRRALRRPIQDDEVSDLVARFQPFAVEGADFYVGIELVLKTLLQEVEFLYRIELGTPAAGSPGVFKLNDYEMATRLSYFLLGTTPPDSLLDLAEAGKLSNPSQVRDAAATLMADPRARSRVERFHALWLGYRQLPHPAELTQALKAESAALIGKVVFDEQVDYFELFRAEQTLLTDYLAGHYGYDAPGSAAGAWTTYPDDRRGILSHGSVLSSFGKFADTSPTQRGIFIRTRLLCEEIPPPPANVNADEPPTSIESNCKLDKYKVHSAGGCAGCHEQMDPIGFGLENYDKAGKYRTHDDGFPECVIPGDGVLTGVGEFNGPAELSELLVSSGGLEQCLVKQVYRFATGRRDKATDSPVLEELSEKFADQGYAFDELLVDVVSTESFGYRRQEE